MLTMTSARCLTIYWQYHCFYAIRLTYDAMLGTIYCLQRKQGLKKKNDFTYLAKNRRYVSYSNGKLY